MKAKTKIFLLFSSIIIGISLFLWGHIIMRNYEGYLEVFRAARNSALPQFIAGCGVLLVGYVVTYIDTK